MSQEEKIWKRRKKSYMRIMARHCVTDRKLGGGNNEQEIMKLFSDYLEVWTRQALPKCCDPTLKLVCNDFTCYLFIRKILKDSCNQIDKLSRINDLFGAMRSAANSAFSCRKNLIHVQIEGEEKKKLTNKYL